VLKCHKACDWIIEKGEKFIAQDIKGFLTKNSHQEKSHSWFLIDGRELFKNPQRSSIDQVLLKTLDQFNQEYQPGILPND